MVYKFYHNEQEFDGKEVLVVQGDAGTGKTIFLRKIQQDLIKEGVFTIFVTLSEIKDYSRSVDETLEKHGYNPDKIIEMKKDKTLKLVIIFDGYDEIKRKVNL